MDPTTPDPQTEPQTDPPEGAAPETPAPAEPAKDPTAEAVAAVDAALKPPEPAKAEGEGEGEEPDKPGTAAKGEAATDAPASQNGEPKPPAGEKPPKPAGPKLSEDDQTIHDGLKPRAQERFRELIGRAERAEAVEEKLTRWEGVIAQTGATPEEFAVTLEYQRLAHQGDDQSLKDAMAILDRERAAIAKRLGVKVDGVDPLDDAADLKRKVETGELGEEDALEIARLRRAATEAAARQQTAQQQQAQAAAIQSGKLAVDQMAEALKAQDPTGYDAKIQSLGPMIEVLATTLPPDQWAEALRRAYVALPATSASAAPRPPISKTQPLRPSPGGGGPGAIKSPGSALEAVNQALGAR